MKIELSNKEISKFVLDAAIKKLGLSGEYEVKFNCRRNGLVDATITVVEKDKDAD